MVKLRLRRTGAKKKPHYRVVAADVRSPRDGRFIEILGHYNPRTDPVTLNIHEDRVLYWLSVGAQPTDTVKKLLENMGTLERFSRVKQGVALEEVLAEATAAHQTQQGEQVQLQTQAAEPVAEVVEEAEQSEEVTETAVEENV